MWKRLYFRDPLEAPLAMNGPHDCQKKAIAGHPTKSHGPQGLKLRFYAAGTARLKPCPFKTCEVMNNAGETVGSNISGLRAYVSGLEI